MAERAVHLNRPPARWGRLDHLAFAGAGLLLLVLAGLGARDGTVSGPEKAVFDAINGLPQWLYKPMWVFQQFGNLAVAFVAVLVVAVVLRRPKLALMATLAVVAKLFLERLVKKVVERQRPGTTVVDATLRGDVSAHGLSFVSGHAVITAAMATLLLPVLPGRWRYLPWAVVALNGIARIYVGAHNPLDIVGGIGLGMAIGGLLNAAFGTDDHGAEGGDEPVSAAGARVTA